VRDAFQHRPSLKSLLASGDYHGPVAQGEYFNLMALSAQLKRCREQANLSLADISRITGIDRAAISRLENGLVENPTVYTLGRLARAVGKTLSFQLTDDGTT